MPPINKWSSFEVEIVKAYYLQGTRKVLSHLAKHGYKRTAGAVIGKANRLGLCAPISKSAPSQLRKL